ncbi:ABC transporter permease [Dyadobacter sp. CY107]|uniref:ABC transporter permease n=1 Tax=Dyadobacter fanqingshengii TaxID=2906443 RepID=UPI001F3DAF71|nr:ABC transporter permease [Dyadobacter fanqingshengii]MCF2504125.1 ABC transporter permease [Dyadobacter fanqingshengii]
MLRNYIKIAFRHLVKNKGYSVINFGGLAVGMAAAMLIGLWVYDELSFNKYHQNYDRIAQLMQQQTLDGEIVTGNNVPIPLGSELKSNFPNDFKHVVLSSWTTRHILSSGTSKFTKAGNFMSPEAAEMLSLEMVHGTWAGLKEPGSVLLSESVANAFFGNADPLNQVIKLDNELNVKVTGVYKDLPYNSEFKEVRFIAPWDLYVASTDWVREAQANSNWSSSSFQIYAQLTEKANVQSVSAKIKDIKARKADQNELRFKPEILLHPMSRWHLYSEWKNGLNVGGRMQFVWLFAVIGLFVLFLACINFMNLSTARSEKRSKEVGIRKAIGSLRGQLIGQFFSESFLIVGIALVISLLLVQIMLPFFNQMADKEMVMLWSNPLFWVGVITFSVVTGLVAGSYPAFYLSSFQPIKTLKGTGARMGLAAALPRKVLVVLQFTVSITLIIGTIVVYRQILHAKSRPIGYNREDLVTIHVNTPDIHNHFNAVLHDLVKAGSATSMTESMGPPTEVRSANVGFDWKGKDPDLEAEFATIGISHDFGKTLGWDFVAGRDFSKTFSTDSAGFILNETAVKFMGLDRPNVAAALGETVKWEGRSFRILGVVKDMIMESPYEPVRQTIFFIRPRAGDFITIRINPASDTQKALQNIEAVFKQYSPDAPFAYEFVDQEYDFKFESEERISNLAAAFASLAILISCLGLFGLASFMAEQRTKEIGVRKVLGASILNLWSLLSLDFITLVLISCLLSAPIAWFTMNNWLNNYEYHTAVSWWIFIIAGTGVLLITMLTVSYQAIKAAMLNPVKSLKSE